MLALLDITGLPFLAYSVIGALGNLATGIVLLTLGIICATGAKFVGSLTWAIILIILGLIGGTIGGGIGALLVIIGALLGLVSRF